MALPFRGHPQLYGWRRTRRAKLQRSTFHLLVSHHRSRRHDPSPYRVHYPPWRPSRKRSNQQVERKTHSGRQVLAHRPMKKMFPNSSSSSLPLAPPPEHNLFDASDDDDALDFDSPSPSPRPAAAAAPAARPAAPTRANRLSANGKQKDIEMAPIVGHRRRKSSLMQPVGGQHGQSVHLGQVPGRSITPIRGHVASSSVAEQPGILEDDGDSGSAFELDDTSRDSFSDEDNNEDEEMGLTSGERAEKRKKKQRSMRLDQRIVPEKSPSPMGRTTEDQSLMRQIMINGGLILLWYLFSLSLSLVSLHMLSLCGSIVAVCSNGIYSITNGCSTRAVSISNSLFLPRRCICWSSLAWPRQCCISYRHYAPIISARPTMGDQDMRKSQTRA